jgi:hypothetical protein
MKRERCAWKNAKVMGLSGAHIERQGETQRRATPTEKSQALLLVLLAWGIYFKETVHCATGAFVRLV